MLVRRIAGSRAPTAIGTLPAILPQMLAEDQTLLLDQSRKRRVARTASVTTVAEAAEATSTGWARVPWDTLGPEAESRLAEQGVSVRCLVSADGSVPERLDPPGDIAVVTRAY